MNIFFNEFGIQINLLLCKRTKKESVSASLCIEVFDSNLLYLFIVLQDAESDGPKADDNGPQMLVDCAVGGTLYIRSALRRNTCAWRQAIRGAAHNNGAALDQQQITNDNIPVIVDKCINFVYAHGSMSEGIYRHSGSGKVISDLLSEFSDDAWAVQLTKDRCSEHDVACVLKRFMRNLPEPALTTKLYPYFCKISGKFCHN